MADGGKRAIEAYVGWHQALERFEALAVNVADGRPVDLVALRYAEAALRAQLGEVMDAAIAANRPPAHHQRELRSGDEIRAAVDELLNFGRKAPLAVPMPTLVLDPDPLEHDANWQMALLPGTKGNEAAIARAIMAVKAKWDLA